MDEIRSAVKKYIREESERFLHTDKYDERLLKELEPAIQNLRIAINKSFGLDEDWRVEE